MEGHSNQFSNEFWKHLTNSMQEMKQLKYSSTTINDVVCVPQESMFSPSLSYE